MNGKGRTFNSRFGPQPGRFREARDEFWSAIGVARVIKRVHADKNITRTCGLCTSGREREKHQIARGHIGNRNIIAYPGLGNIDGIGESRATECGQIESDLDLIVQTQPFGNVLG